jgi:hypothetical protein
VQLSEIQLETEERMNALPPVKAEMYSMRIAPVDYAISSTPLKFGHDLACLSGYIQQLFDEWHSSDSWYREQARKQYMAPYFPIVQSSGMGKTKLLYEYKQRSKDTACRLIRCVNVLKSNEKETDTFDSLLAPPEDVDHGARKWLFAWMDQELETVPDGTRKVVFMFDEAQHLMINDGYPFRVIRWWIRDMIPPQYEVVAVFSSTSSRLTNFFREDPASSTSRDPAKKTIFGKELFRPFYSLCTVGCFANDAGKRNVATEYEKAVYHGRPLFARMLIDGMLASAHGNILVKLLLGNVSAEWARDTVAVFSILSTRIQMGQVSVPATSTLVAAGYAGLTLFYRDENEGNNAQFCQYPDPVCARLAMCLMDDKTKIANYYGMPKTWWAEKAKDQFSSGFCRPSQGDTAEVFTALYLLFCGDVLRARKNTGNENYVHFSVSLQDWASTLVNGGVPPDESALSSYNQDDKPWQPRPEISLLGCLAGR